MQPSVCRILDANLDRAREGLRIIEEWCRLGLNHQDLAVECKNMRQELGGWHTSQIRAWRDTPNDPGTGVTHANEAHRTNISEILQVNFCRIQEALRVIEEYGKLDQPSMAQSCKQMRYRVYTLESNLLNFRRHQILQKSLLYLITSPCDKLLDIVEASLKGGLMLIQYRDKESKDSVKYYLAQKLSQVCRKYGALLIVNDRVDLAIAVEADGVHLGQEDLPISIARELLGPHRIIGKSTTNKDEMLQALKEGVDYIGVGPVHETPTKPGKMAAGYEYVKYAAQNSSIPWFAIGGIEMSNLHDTMKAGAQRVAVVRAIMNAEQPTLMTQYFNSQLNKIESYG